MEPRATPRPGLRSAGVTAREAEVFWLVGERLHNAEVAQRLHLSERTVESHVSSLLRRLGGTSRQFLVEEAARLRAAERVAPRPPELPRPVSAFIGREEEVEVVTRLLEGYPLVILTGPAGAGKTRLAVEVAARTGPAAVVDLSMVRAAEDVLRAVAEQLGVSTEGLATAGGAAGPGTADKPGGAGEADGTGARGATGGRGGAGARSDGTIGLVARIRDLLAEEGWLLVLDNCEHVVDAAAELVAGLLTRAGVRVLATSLRPLRVAGETIHEVLPLAVPPAGASAAEVRAAPAGRLFVERVGRVLPGFDVDEGTAPDIAAICRGLDGLPLAIELAAARARAFSAAELRRRLEDDVTRAGVLADGTPGRDGRHETLERAIRWSYDLLGPDEQVLFERCAAFAAPFDYDSVAAVAGTAPLTASSLAAAFPRLLDRSMVVARRRGEVTEFRLLDSLRRFALDRLAEQGLADAVRDRHASYHLERAAGLGESLMGPQQRAAWAWFAARWADVGEAVRWSLTCGRPAEVWAFLAGVGSAWEVLGARGEVFGWLEAVAADPLPPGSAGVRAAWTASLLWGYQDVERTEQWARRADRLARATGSERDLATGALALGWAGMYRGSPDAVSLLAQASAGFERLGDRWHVAFARECRGIASTAVDAALACFDDAATQFGQIGDDVKRANCLVHLAARAVGSRRRLEEVPQWLEEAARLAADIGAEHEQVHAALWQAGLALLTGASDDAYPAYAALLPRFRRLGDSRCTGRCLCGLGLVEARQWDDEGRRDEGLRRRARAHLEEGVELLRRTTAHEEAAAARTALELVRG